MSIYVTHGRIPAFSAGPLRRGQPTPGYAGVVLLRHLSAQGPLRQGPTKAGDAAAHRSPGQESPISQVRVTPASLSASPGTPTGYPKHVISRLADALRAADYTTDAVCERITDAGQEGLGRNCTVPADVALDGASDPQATMIRLWLLQQDVAERDAADALPMDALLARGYLVRDQGRVRAGVDVRPYGSPDDEASGWVVSDLQPGLDGILTPTRPDYVLGVSPASTTLAQLTARAPVGSALDLGTGCGVQSLHLSRHASRVVATDVNPRALELARITCELSGIDIDLRDGSLYEPTPERFDLIVSNPPFVMSPPTGQRLTYRESNFTGDALVETLVRQAATHLTPGGSLQLLTNWAILDQPWQERLTAWTPPGCDAWYIERERLDVYSYIEMWLADAGLAGTPGWRTAYREWLDYFAHLGIRAVGMGWIQLVNTGRERPDVVAESWPHQVSQPVGGVFAARRLAVDAARLPDGELLASRWVLASDVQQETLGDPGAEDPEFIVYRQRTGLCRAMKLDTASAAVLGACDGDLTLGELCGAVGQLLGSDITMGVLPVVRQALRDGLLER